MLKEFKEFAMRGNVVDMAVGIIIGAAFGKIVSSFVNDVIMPPIGMLMGGMDFSSLAIALGEGEGAASINYGVFINTVLDFLIVARVAAAAEVLLAAIAVAANLRQARSALAASETKFSRAFRSSPDALTLSTLEDGRFIEVNDTFEKISGYGREEAIGRTPKELGLWPGESRTGIAEALREDGSVQQKEAVIIDKSGRRVPVQFSAERIELGGRPVLLATVRDITFTSSGTGNFIDFDSTLGAIALSDLVSNFTGAGGDHVEVTDHSGTFSLTNSEFTGGVRGLDGADEEGGIAVWHVWLLCGRLSVGACCVLRWM